MTLKNKKIISAVFACGLLAVPLASLAATFNFGFTNWTVDPLETLVNKSTATDANITRQNVIDALMAGQTVVKKYLDLCFVTNQGYNLKITGSTNTKFEVVHATVSANNFGYKLTWYNQPKSDLTGATTTSFVDGDSGQEKTVETPSDVTDLLCATANSSIELEFTIASLMSMKPGSYSLPLSLESVTA